MGVDCHIYLPEYVRIYDVAKAVGIAAGNKPEFEYLPSGGWLLKMPHAKAEATSVPELAFINYRIGIENHPHYNEDGMLYYHFESSIGGRLLSARTSGRTVAIGHRLVDLFGGMIQYNDCDDLNKPDWVNFENPIYKQISDDEWEKLQRKLAEIMPVTYNETLTYAEKTAYGNC